MEKIIQLKQNEYNDLFEKANLNEQEIAKKAEDLYQQKGTYGIKLQLDFEKSNYSDKVAFKSNSWVKDWDNTFPLSQEDKRKIVEFVARRADQFMEKRYGRQVYSINFYKDAIQELNNLRKTYNTVTILGWGVAVIMILVLMLK